MNLGESSDPEPVEIDRIPLQITRYDDFLDRLFQIPGVDLPSLETFMSKGYDIEAETQEVKNIAMHQCMYRFLHTLK